MPFREEKPLGNLIAPDRRRQKTVILVVIGMLMGAGVLYALQQVTKETPTVVSTVQPTAFSATLSGPDGTFAVPMRGKRTIVHVWLQACSDCMPAFEAMKSREIELAFVDAEVINVAFGSADTGWAAQYGVRKNLVFDHGGAKVVHPLGISSFTTLVFDEEGKIIARDRPDRPGYVGRIRALVDVGSGPLGERDVQDDAPRSTRRFATDAGTCTARSLPLRSRSSRRSTEMVTSSRRLDRARTRVSRSASRTK